MITKKIKNLKALKDKVIITVMPCERDGCVTMTSKKTYSSDAVQHGPALGQEESVVEDDE
jgi:hypothetical protein